MPSKRQRCSCPRAASLALASAPLPSCHQRWPRAARWSSWEAPVSSALKSRISLATQGVKVVSVSRRSAAAQAQKVQYEQFVDFVSLDASKDDLSSVFKGASASGGLMRRRGAGPKESIGREWGGQ